MKKRFYSKNNKKKKRVKKYFFLLIFILALTLSYQYLDQNIKKKDQKDLVEILLSNEPETNLITKMFSLLLPKEAEVTDILAKNYKGLVKKNAQKVAPVVKNEAKKDSNPTIYIYNTHQTEEYKARNFIEESVRPTVQMNNYILEDVFTRAGYNTLVEEKSIKEVLNSNHWNYAGSYKASRIFLETAKQENPTLKYFLDVHRDSLPKDKTTTMINEKSYAKILFIVGLENPNYMENLNFTEKINQKLIEKYPNLSKGIYKKAGPGVNGVYNQDLSPRSILVEIGGPENSIDEVLNTSLAFAECFLEVLKDEV